MCGGEGEWGGTTFLKLRAGSWSLRALRLESDCGPLPPGNIIAIGLLTPLLRNVGEMPLGKNFRRPQIFFL